MMDIFYAVALEIPKRNLDIEVPIGYNVVIVKVGKTLQKFR